MQNSDQTCVNTIRFLSVDQVESAKSGHPGLPLGAAPMAYALFARRLRFDPSRPDWLDRDRFVLSAGHGSSLLYSLLHLFGYDLALDELKRFRQLGSLTPGHPERGLAPGVEATTGPLGQGLANGVGMAIAREHMKARWGDAISHRVFVLASDGDLMEGIGAEAASLAGHLRLGSLVVLYDDNDISLDGPTGLAFTENVGAKHEAMGWHVQRVADGNDLEAITSAIDAATEDPRPSLICVKTVIGYGSPKAGSSEAHGAPLGPAASDATKTALGWPLEPKFHIPAEAANLATEAKAKGAALTAEWDQRVAGHPALAEMECVAQGGLPADWSEDLDALTFAEGMATRDAGKSALNAAAKRIPWLLGGGADLASSTKTVISGSPNFQPASPEGRNIWFGVREHAMGAAVNGLCYSGLRGFGSTFLVFSDYMRGSIRLSALTHLPSIWVFTHDSVFVGEDGPTHEPIEHVSSLRLIPNLKVYRPADAWETRECWRLALERGEACCLILTRQKVGLISPETKCAQGAYVVHAPENPEVVLLATGSEVHLAFAAAKELAAQGVSAQVVSMPCVELFREQPIDIQNSVLPPDLPVVAIEAGAGAPWHEFTGTDGLVISIERFGESAPGEVVYEHLGFTPGRVVGDVLNLLGRETP